MIALGTLVQVKPECGHELLLTTDGHLWIVTKHMPYEPVKDEHYECRSLATQRAYAFYRRDLNL